MNLIQVEYFLAVAEKLNFTVAAKSLFISQPALSKQIKLLEEELDTQLFIRDSRKVMLTAAGEKFRVDLLEIVERLETAKNNAIMIGKKEQSLLEIGCFDGAVVDDFLPQVIKTINSASLATRIRIHRGSFSEIRSLLSEEKVDVIITMDFELPELYAFNTKKIALKNPALIYSENSVLGSKADLTLQDFEALPLLVLSPVNSEGAYRGVLTLMDQLGLHNLKIDKMDDTSMLLTYLDMGYGFAVLGDSVPDRRSNLKKMELTQSIASRSIVIAWHSEDAFVNTLMNNF